MQIKLTDNTQIQELCIALLKSDTEDEVIKILKKAGLWADSHLWRYLGDSPGNYSTAGNQQADPVASLVEKLVNSIDAVLISECWEAGIDPKSESAPNNMFEAVEKFFKVPQGLIENLDASERTSLSERIHLVATGAKSRDPCYTIIDKGEGQTASNMPKTILSLPTTSAPNKSKIKFVQGIFNMGGTGVLRFCGETNLELIISKRNPKLLPSQPPEKDTLWAFTIIRRKNPTKQRESSVYEYLAPHDKLLTFQSNSVPALPGKFPHAYSEPLKSGTCIKLYEYRIPGKKANIQFDLNYDLSRHFQRMALPIRLSERREFGSSGKKFKGHTFDVTLAGMSVRLETDRNDIVEDNFPIFGSLNVEKVGVIPYTIYAFKNMDPDSRKRYHQGAEIVLTVNGQKHGILDKALFSRREVGLEFLSNTLMVDLNCSNISPRAREDLFLASRDRLANGIEKINLQNALVEELKENDVLQQLAQKRKDELAQKALKDDQSMKEVLNKLLKQVPGLEKLFPSYGPVIKQSSFTWKKIPGKYAGKVFPTFFRLENDIKKINLHCPINSTANIIFEHDAANDYFSRSRNRGQMIISDPTMEKSHATYNGITKIKIQPRKDSKIGEKISLEIKVIDKRQEKPWVFKGKIRITKEKKKTPPPPPPPPPPPHPPIDYTRTKEEQPGETGEGGMAMPKIYVLREGEDQQWTDEGFTKYTGCKLKVDKNDFTVLVNGSNEYLKKEIEYNKDEDPAFIVKMFKLALAMCAVGMYHQLDLKSKNSMPSTDDSKDVPIQEKVSEASDGLAMILLPMINNLGKEARRIKIPDENDSR